MPDPAEQPFLDEILANPADVTPRLIFADWLEERDDPRAEFIRVQCELAEMSPEDERWVALQKREAELLANTNALTHVDLPSTAKSRRFRRGFVEMVAISVPDFLIQRKSLFAKAPIRHLWLTDGAGKMRELAECRQLRNVAALELSRCELDDADLKELLKSSYLSRLEYLNVSNNRITDDSMLTLAETKQLPGLRRLDLSGNGDIRGRGLWALGRSTTITDLQELFMNGCRFSETAFLDLMQSSSVHKIEKLALVSTPLSDASMVGIATSPTLSVLKYLAISSSDNSIGSYGIWALANAENSKTIRHLNVSGNLDDQSLQAIASSECFEALRHLVLLGPDVGDNGMVALADSPRLAQLRRLTINDCRITFHGVDQLMRSAFRHPDLRVSVNSNSLTSEDQRELHQLFGKSALVF